MSDAGHVYSADSPVTVERVAMRHRWDQLTFLHWGYDPALVQAVLPNGLTVETYEGRAWVGLVPFLMEVRSKRGVAWKWPWRFAETNVRTYVVGPNGERGVWFFSLEASRIGAVPLARSTYRVRYFWSGMSVQRVGDTIHYRSHRRWPGPRGASSDVRVEMGEAYRPDELTEFDHYLTARWHLFGTWGGQLLTAAAWHQPWPLHRAEATWSQDLIEAAGLPSPVGEPIVHWSPGVNVQVGFPTRTG